MPVLLVPVRRHLEAAAAEVEVVGVSRLHQRGGRSAKAQFSQCISYLNLITL